jgi:hypothetical protein
MPIQSKPRVSDTPIFLRSFERAWRRPAAYLTSTAGLVLLGMLGAYPAYRTVDALAENRYPIGSQRFNLEANFWVDHATKLSELFSAVSTAAGLLAFLAWCFGIFTAGGWLRMLLDPGRGNGRLFIVGGARYFWRFVRLALLLVLLLHFIGVLCHGALWKDWVVEGLAGLRGGKLELADSELTVRRLDWAQSSLYSLCVALLLAWALFTRARLVLQNRRSVLLAGAETAWLLLRHPIRTLRPLALLLVFEALGLAGLTALFRGLEGGLREPDGAAWRMPLLLALALLFVLWRELTHGARYAAALEVSTELVKPLVVDPWQDRVGGPGGPQYPLSDSDEFRVSM